MKVQDIHFVFVIETGFTMQAFSSAVEVVRVARKLGASKALSYSVASLNDCATAASNGIEVLPNCAINELPKQAILVIVSGAGADRNPNPGLIKSLRRWARAGHAIWALSSGVVRLAQAGLLDDCKVSAHWEDVPYLKEYHPRVELSNSLFHLAGKHPTSSGGGAAADLMLDFIGQHTHDDLIADVAARLMIDGVRDGRVRQPVPAALRYTTPNRTVFAALRMMEENLYEVVPIRDIARHVGASQRQLERLFKAEFGKTPKVVYLDMRLDEARQEVLAGHRAVVDIATDYGFAVATFSKAYRRIFGATPTEDRNKRSHSMS
ncbi:AraC family transcriptional regulator with amidase-like domain [Yoonia maricola]|uniref:AraC family transcriptional regulator with amidase-like domain n=1 Tax=Yoonia maricola TaxID=420999 RepID=A0A2M8W5N3_9RHOB|nr:helix-turn-helix domain-containing protein [Yoonia maricola]PJI86224.1 AraC family transcriptional regulator with amidase-like domain [Yoonia maricola]